MAATVSTYWQHQRRIARPLSRDPPLSYPYTEPTSTAEDRRASAFEPRCRERREPRPRRRDACERASDSRRADNLESTRKSVREHCQSLEPRGAGGVAGARGAEARAGAERCGRGERTRSRLELDTRWTNVEEVRKRFESGCSTSFSRSFESPPRRRLADSIFASLKLPRRRDNANNNTGTNTNTEGSMSQQRPQRKSAVQLLNESKALYVKSETVRDRKQDIPAGIKLTCNLGQAIASVDCVAVCSKNPTCCQPYGNISGSRPVSASARLGTNGSVQSTLRRLLRHEDSISLAHKPREPRGHSGTLPAPPKRRQQHVYMEPVTQELVNTYSIPSPLSSPERVSLPPPMRQENEFTDQYMHTYRDRYIRSNSQSGATIRRCEEDINMDSHKSLPDLHTHVRAYDNVSTSGAETMGRSPRRRRHSTHQRTASCSSKGTRSNHSSLVSSSEAYSEHPSPGDENYTYNRCNSALARDSGGSSGHCTQRSTQPHRSYYASVGYAAELPDWPVSAPPQFQDGAPSPPQPAHAHHLDTRVSIHLQASAPPPQFQDDPPARDDRRRATTERRKSHHQRTDSSPAERIGESLVYAEPRMVRPGDTVDYVNAQQVQASLQGVTSPLGTFKRQRCLRYKQRETRPILRSKSDVCDSRASSFGGRESPPRAPRDRDLDLDSSSDSSSARLANFFARLGLERRAYERLIAPAARAESPVYFSDVSTADSDRPAAAGDYTVQGIEPRAPVRHAEPPSIVERNARIIKWLCNCRKLQAT